MRNVVIAGMMGSGKTAVAEALARRLGWRSVDTDQLVQKDAGMTVAALFATEGEEAFRDAESATIASLGASSGPLVVSVGGGAVVRPGNRDAMKRLGTVVWLRAEPASLAARVGSGEGRPVLGGGALDADETAGRLADLAEQRRPFYEQVADLVVDTDELSPDEVAGQIVRELKLLSEP
jgi:shikimate kinase